MKRWRFLTVAIVIIVAFGLALFWYWSSRNGDTALPGNYATKQSNTAVPKLDHAVIVMEENHGESAIIGSQDAPYINSLATQYTLATNYYATAHPSLPNYLELTSGTNGGITNDCNPPGGNCVANTNNIADEIEQSGRSWKEYAESMSAPCTTHNAGDYATKHNPWVYYPNILNNQKRCNAHVVPFSQLASDLKNNSLPAYSFITPNLCHDMHNCSIKTGDDWLKSQLPVLLNSHAFKSTNSLLVITWDESEGNGPNHVPAIFVGPSVKRSYKTAVAYSHYSLLHTIEKSWNLDTLTKNDPAAPVITDIFATST